MKTKPQHISFILDGNRRWARREGLPIYQGHMKGMDNVENIMDWCIEEGVTHLTVYAFSTENWDREEEELNYLFTKVYNFGFSEKFPKYHKKNVKVNLFGSLDRFPKKMQEGIWDLVNKTKDNTGLVLNVCLDYGGKLEITKAVKEIVAAGTAAEDITSDLIESHLYSAGMPPIDMMIRTGGEHRLSNFLLWQHAYTELYFPTKFLPEFSKEDFAEALEWYASRERRYGK